MKEDIKTKKVQENTPYLKTVLHELNKNENNYYNKQKVNEHLAGKVNSHKAITFKVTGNHE
ncbi:MAG: hypothetical protein V4717_22265 [Bacteroidota bacterium]